MTHNSAGRLLLPVQDWPESDRLLWQAGLDPGDGLDEEERYGLSLSPVTVRNAARGYGSWLAFAAAQDWLKLPETPAERVVPARVRAYLKALLARGNSNSTACARMWELRTALGIMAPGADFSWLTSPGGRDLRALLPAKRPRRKVHHSRELFEWGRGLMDQAIRDADGLRRCMQYRNGLLIAILAARAPRLRSIFALRLGRDGMEGVSQIVTHGAVYRMILEPEDMKTETFLEYNLPDLLTPYVQRYVACERAVMMGTREHRWFWVNQQGTRFGQRGIEGMIRRASHAHFGEAFGTHAFRHAFATTAPAPAAAVLGISRPTVEKHYNKGRQHDAAKLLQQVIGEERTVISNRTNAFPRVSGAAPNRN